MKKETNKKAWIFLVVVVILFLMVFITNQEKGIKILQFYGHLLMQVLPILVLVYFILLLTNYFVDNKMIKKYMLDAKGYKIWLFTIVAGILSVGPIYMWFPLLKDLKDKGVKDRYLASFLYNRGIKLQWLPVLVLYFGLKYVLVLAFVMTFFSIPQGIITEYFSNKEKV
jgi:uncharacterized membrane protein YraQ (UPF0718 family)